MGDLLDFLKFVMAMVIFVAVVLFGLLATGNFYNQWTCSNFANMSSKQTKFIFWDTCYIQEPNGSFIRYDEYIARATAQNLKGN